MSCNHIYDFINDTKIVMPRLRRSEGRQCVQGDIVRPNRKAEEVILAHRTALDAFQAKRRPRLAAR
jgi:hypothetical protein